MLLSRQGLHVYDKMATDEQVQAVLKFKRDAILSRQWDFVFESNTTLDADAQKDRKQLLRQIINEMKGSFTDSMGQLLRAMRHGFSLTEKIFDLVEIDGKAYYACTELRKKPPYTFYFKTNEFGDLKEFGQGQGTGNVRVLDLGKFIHYVCNPDEDEFYGRSELRAAYRSWYMKDVLIKMQALALERGTGLVIVEQDSDAPMMSKEDLAAVNSAIANFKAISGMILPKGLKAVITSPAVSEAMAEAILYHDLGIAKALLVPNLLGVSNSGQTGAYAQSQTQLQAFFWTLKADTDRLESALNEQLLPDLCINNFGDGQYPRFSFKDADTDFTKWAVEQWMALTGANDVVNTEADEERLREILNMPPRGPDDKPLVTPAQKQAADQFNAELNDPPDPNADPNDPPDPKAKGKGNQFARKIVAHTPTGDPLTCSKEAFSRALQRVAFSVIEQRTTTYASEAAEKLSRMLAAGVNRYLTKAQAVWGDASKISQIQFDGASVKKIKAAFIDALDRGFKLGEAQANNEIANARKLAGQHSRRVFGALRSTDATSFLDANGHRMAGNLLDGASSIIQQSLLQAIKAGDRPEVAAATIYQRLIDKGFTDLSAANDSIDQSDVKDALNEALGTETEEGTLAYLNTLTRTNIFEAFNEARYAAFTDPDLEGFVEALEYSAILDDRTTSICRDLNGFTAAADSQDWDTYRPPNHYNCRSVLVPITQVDGWDGKDSPTPEVKPADGFGPGEK